MTRYQGRWGRLATVLAVAGLTGAGELRPAAAAGPDAAQLAAWLKQYPTADTDRDGALTLEEAQAYRRKLAAGGGGNDRREPPQGMAPTEHDVRYGTYARNVLDFYRAAADKPTPVLICFHGGGFVGGDKGSYAADGFARRCVAAGISVVSANYRFVKPGNGEPGHPFPAAMMDGARVIQFVRSKAKEWNLDPRRVALTGGSAGACMSVWLAVHDDLAKPDSPDPLERESTRVSCVIGRAGQTTLDPVLIKEKVGGGAVTHPSLLPLYGATALEDLEQPAFRALIQEASALNHVNRGDPPLFLQYGGPLAGAPLPVTATADAVVHHAMLGKLMKDRYEAAGLTCELACQDVRPAMSDWDFLRRWLELPGETARK